MILAELGVLLLLSVVLWVDWLVGQSPLDHSVHFLDGLAERGRLEASMDVGLEDGFVVKTFVEVVAFNLLHSLGVYGL